MNGNKVGLGIVAGTVAMAQVALATEYDFLNARAGGMGGTGAVSTRDATVQWYNPAVLGFMHQKPMEVATTNEVVSEAAMTNEVMAEAAATNESMDATSSTNMLDESSLSSAPLPPPTGDMFKPEKQEPVYNPLDRNGLSKRDFGWNILDVGVGYAMTADMGKYLNLFDSIDFDAFGEDGLEGTKEGIKSMLAIGSALGSITADDAILVNMNAGMGFRFGHWGIGIRGFGEAAAYILPDLENFSINQTLNAFSQELNDAVVNSGYDGTGFQTMDVTQYNTLVSRLESGGLTTENAKKAASYLDDQLTDLKNTTSLSDEQLKKAIDLVNDINFEGDLADNTSVAVGRAFGVIEIPVSYGHAFLDDRLSVGITAKGMYGTVTGANIWFFDENAIDDAVEVASDNTEGTLNFGLDLGVLYRLPMVQLGIVGHNLNSPKFKGFEETITVGNQTRTILVDDVTLDPQITLGAAFIPNKRFMLEMNYDVLKTGTLLDGYDIQRLSFGTELDVWLLALRLGAYRNMALDNPDWVATAGIGLNIFGVRADIGGAYSLGDPVTYEGTDIPNEARLFASISLDY